MTEHIGIIASALIGALAGIIGLFWGRRKLLAGVGKLQAEAGAVKADEAEKLTGIAMRLMDELRARLEESEAMAQRQNEALQNRVAELERLSLEQNETLKELGKKLEKSNSVIRALLRGIALLIHQLQGLNVTPAFTIPVYEDGGIEEIEQRILNGIKAL